MALTLAERMRVASKVVEWHGLADSQGKVVIDDVNYHDAMKVISALDDLGYLQNGNEQLCSACSKDVYHCLSPKRAGITTVAEIPDAPKNLIQGIERIKVGSENVLILIDSHGKLYSYKEGC